MQPESQPKKKLLIDDTSIEEEENEVNFYHPDNELPTTEEEDDGKNEPGSTSIEEEAPTRLTKAKPTNKKEEKINDKRSFEDMFDISGFGEDRENRKRLKKDSLNSRHQVQDHGDNHNHNHNHESGINVVHQHDIKFPKEEHIQKSKKQKDNRRGSGEVKEEGDIKVKKESLKQRSMKANSQFVFFSVRVVQFPLGYAPKTEYEAQKQEEACKQDAWARRLASQSMGCAPGLHVESKVRRNNPNGLDEDVTRLANEIKFPLPILPLKRNLNSEDDEGNEDGNDELDEEEQNQEVDIAEDDDPRILPHEFNQERFEMLIRSNSGVLHQLHTSSWVVTQIGGLIAEWADIRPKFTSFARQGPREYIYLACFGKTIQKQSKPLTCHLAGGLQVSIEMIKSPLGCCKTPFQTFRERYGDNIVWEWSPTKDRYTKCVKDPFVMNPIEKLLNAETKVEMMKILFAGGNPQSLIYLNKILESVEFGQKAFRDDALNEFKGYKFPPYALNRIQALEKLPHVQKAKILHLKKKIRQARKLLRFQNHQEDWIKQETNDPFQYKADAKKRPSSYERTGEERMECEDDGETCYQEIEYTKVKHEQQEQKSTENNDPLRELTKEVKRLEEKFKGNQDEGYSDDDQDTAESSNGEKDDDNENINMEPEEVLFYEANQDKEEREFTPEEEDVHEWHVLISIYEWFLHYCNGTGDRKKALVIFSEKRALGKTTLAKLFVGYNPAYQRLLDLAISQFEEIKKRAEECDLYRPQVTEAAKNLYNLMYPKQNVNKMFWDDKIIICRNTFQATAFQKPGAELVILDDMNFWEKEQNEMWKALVTSEATTIRGAYLNFYFPHGKPCIITTNCFKFVKHLSTHDYYRTSVHIVEPRKFLGPPGTNPNLNVSETPVTVLAPDTRRKINVLRKQEAVQKDYKKRKALREMGIHTQGTAWSAPGPNQPAPFSNSQTQSSQFPQFQGTRFQPQPQPQLQPQPQPQPQSHNNTHSFTSQTAPQPVSHNPDALNAQYKKREKMLTDQIIMLRGGMETRDALLERLMEICEENGLTDIEVKLREKEGIGRHQTHMHSTPESYPRQFAKQEKLESLFQAFQSTN